MKGNIPRKAVKNNTQLLGTEIQLQDTAQVYFCTLLLQRSFKKKTKVPISLAALFTLKQQQSFNSHSESDLQSNTGTNKMESFGGVLAPLPPYPPATEHSLISCKSSL